MNRNNSLEAQIELMKKRTLENEEAIRLAAIKALQEQHKLEQQALEIKENAKRLKLVEEERNQKLLRSFENREKEMMDQIEVSNSKANAAKCSL